LVLAYQVGRGRYFYKQRKKIGHRKVKPGYQVMLSQPYIKLLEAIYVKYKYRYWY